MSESRSEVAAFIKENKVDAIYTSKLAEMEQLLAKLQGGLHLEAHIDSLAAAQKAFDKIYKERLTELKGKTPSQNKTVRLKLQEIYDFLVDFTAIGACAYPEQKHMVTLRNRCKKRKPIKKITPTQPEEAK